MGVLVAAGASLATSAPPSRAYPSWEVTGDSGRRVGCSVTRAFIARSGKQGIGVGFSILGLDSCNVTATAQLHLAGITLKPDKNPGFVHVTEKDTRYLYVPIFFDNNASWNRGEREAELEVIVQAGDDKQRWTTSLLHRMNSFYKNESPENLFEGFSGYVHVPRGLERASDPPKPGRNEEIPIFPPGSDP